MKHETVFYYVNEANDLSLCSSGHEVRPMNDLFLSSSFYNGRPFFFFFLF
jgi:hypothetical protein